MPDADIFFYFDPVCPFACLTSKWVRMVQAQCVYAVDWRFISLRMINAAVDYDSHFPVGYAAGHTAGLRLLRIAARTRPSTAAARSGRCTRPWAHGSSTPPPIPAGPTATSAAWPAGKCGRAVSRALHWCPRPPGSYLLPGTQMQAQSGALAPGAGHRPDPLPA